MQEDKLIPQRKIKTAPKNGQVIRANHPYFAIQKTFRAKKAAQLQMIAQIELEVSPDQAQLPSLNQASEVKQPVEKAAPKTELLRAFFQEMTLSQENDFLDAEVIEEEILKIDAPRPSTPKKIQSSPAFQVLNESKPEPETIPDPEPNVEPEPTFNIKPQAFFKPVPKPRPKLEEQPLDESKGLKREQGFLYFQAFDKYNLQGLKEITTDLVPYPFVKIAENPNPFEITIELVQNQEQISQESFLKINDYYLNKKIRTSEQDKFPFSYFYTFVNQDVELCYHYRYKNYPNSVPETPILASFYQAQGHQQKIYEFASQDTFYIAPNPSTKMSTFEANAERIRELEFSRENQVIILNELIWDRYAHTEQANAKKQSRIPLQNHPFFTLDYVPPTLL